MLECFYNSGNANVLSLATSLFYRELQTGLILFSPAQFLTKSTRGRRKNDDRIAAARTNKKNYWHWEFKNLRVALL